MSPQLPPTGDPFTKAYARNGSSLPASRKPSRKQGRGLGNGDYAGYGVEPAAPQCAPSPDQALQDCVEAFARIMTDVIQRFEKVPWIDPPYRARPVGEHRQAVLSVTVAVDAAANATGLLLQAAESAPGYAVPLLEMGSASDYKTIFTLTPNQSYMVRIKSWGISSSPGGPKSIATRVKTASVGGTPAPPNPFLSSHQASQQQDTFVILQAEQTLDVQVGLRDLASPTVVDFGIYYWLWPVNKRIDSREGAILRSGYGGICSE